VAARRGTLIRDFPLSFYSSRSVFNIDLLLLQRNDALRWQKQQMYRFGKAERLPPNATLPLQHRSSLAFGQYRSDGPTHGIIGHLLTLTVLLVFLGGGWWYSIHTLCRNTGRGSPHRTMLASIPLLTFLDDRGSSRVVSVECRIPCPYR
jgi:hypothetical protein